MQRVDKILAELSIPINISPENTPASSSESEVCPNCRGAGYLREDVPIGHPNFGRLLPCQCKVDQIKSRTFADLARVSNLDAFVTQTFSNFDPSVAGVREAFLRCREYANNPQGWLVLLGGFGCGKTHLAAAIANFAVSRGNSTYFAVAPDLLDRLRAAYAPNNEISYDDRFEAVRTVPLLVVDDLGTENTTPWAREKLYQIFNHRYNYGMPTVVTTNRDLNTLDPRIASRLCDRRLCGHVYMQAGDYRPGGVQPQARPRTPTRQVR